MILAYVCGHVCTCKYPVMKLNSTSEMNIYSNFMVFAWEYKNFEMESNSCQVVK